MEHNKKEIFTLKQLSKSVDMSNQTLPIPKLIRSDQSPKLHREWEKENSLTSPLDRDKTIKYPVQTNEPPLENNELKNAISDLCDSTYITKFYKKLDRRYCDPLIKNQLYGLISFVPSKGAQPDKQGVYGFAKIRGNYNTLQESEKRAHYLVREVDSYHKIYTAAVGRPFPLTISSNYSQEVDEVDIKKTMTESISNAVKRIKKQETKSIEEIKEKEKRLQEEVDKENTDPFERYTTMQVKKAQLTWSYDKTYRKMIGMQKSILATRKELEDYDKEYPDFKNKHYEHYLEARKKSGVDINLQSDKQKKDNWMQYLCNDIVLPFDEGYVFKDDEVTYSIIANPGPKFKPAPLHKDFKSLNKEYIKEKEKLKKLFNITKDEKEVLEIFRKIKKLDDDWLLTEKNYDKDKAKRENDKKQSSEQHKKDSKNKNSDDSKNILYL